MLLSVVGNWNKSMSGLELANQFSRRKPLFTLVPGHGPIELLAYYSNFADSYLECELQTKRWFVENMGRDWVCFDVGANIGYFSILFSRLAPEGRIYAFESADVIGLLQKNLAHHNVHNVEPIMVALGSCSGQHSENVFQTLETTGEAAGI